MPRPAIHAYWQEEIGVLAEANDAKLSVEAIVASLKEQEPPTSVSGPVPSARTVARYVKDHRNAKEKDRLPYRVFSWPESMELGALPWEASRACLDLLRFRCERNMGAPLIREVRWFWRVTLAAPNASIARRSQLALALSLQAVGVPEDQRDVEALQWELAFQPWADRPEDKEAYDRAIRDEKIPRPRGVYTISVQEMVRLFGFRAAQKPTGPAGDETITMPIKDALQQGLVEPVPSPGKPGMVRLETTAKGAAEFKRLAKQRKPKPRKGDK